MNRPDPNYERQQRLEEVLAVYMQRVDRGELVDREAFVCEHPELADDLRAYFAGADQVEQMAGPQLEATIDSDPRRPSAVPPIDVVRYFGDYELLEEIARGGMGVVFKARQVTLNRIVAVKMILSGQLASPADVERFHAEAEAAANLDHPGIVPIFEVGEHQGQHYFSMGFVDGRSLSARVAEGPSPAREAAQLMKTVCDAVQYAHEHHVIHRDLKPANILLDREGRPRVTDFGLAKRVQDDSGLTATGQVLGTPSYMPPEQAQGKPDLVGPAADVYSLGAIFYTLLTGRPPFQAANSMDTLRQVLEKEPLSPRDFVPDVPQDLETIALKCLEKSIPQRYASARELGDDLQRFLDGRPILARPVSRVERGWRWCRRNPAVATLSAGLLLVLIAISIVAPIVAIQQAFLRNQAETLVGEKNQLLAMSSTQKAIQLVRSNRLQTAQAVIREAFAKYDEGQITQSLLLHAAALTSLEEPQESDPEPLVRQTPQAAFLAASIRAHLGADYLGANCPDATLNHQGAVNSVCFSPDGTKLATGSWDKTVRLWDVATGKPLGDPLQNQGSVVSVRLSPDGTKLATAEMFRTAQLWDVASGKPLGERLGKSLGTPLQHEGQVNSVCFSPDGTKLATASAESTARLWDVASGKPLGEPLQHQGDVNSVCFSPDGTKLATASDDGAARLWDVASGKLLRKLLGKPLKQNRNVVSVCFSPDGTKLATTELFGHTVWLWDVASGKPIGEPLQHQWLQHPSLVYEYCRVVSVCFSPDGTKLATATAEEGVHAAWLWDVASGKLLGEPLRHRGSVNSVCFSPDGTKLATASDDHAARLWDVASGNPLCVPLQHRGAVHSVCFSPDGTKLATASDDNTARLWGVTRVNHSARPLQDFNVKSVCFSPDSRKLAIASRGSRGDTARLWDAASGKPLGEPLPHQGPVRSDSFSPDGTKLATAPGDNTAWLWDVATGKPLGKPLQQQPSLLTSVCFSPDGTKLATTSQDGAARLWDVASGKPLSGELQADYSSVCFSPDGTKLATVSGGNTARLWDVASGKPLGEPLGGERPDAWRVTYISVCFSPDGTKLATSSGLDNVNAVRLWDVGSGKQLGEPLPHQGPVRSDSFSPDGTKLATAPGDNTARLWDVANGKPLGEPLEHEYGAIRCVCFSPDGTKLATASDDNTARLWDMANGKLLGEPLQHEGRVGSVCFSPDGTQLATVSRGDTARLWDVPSDVTESAPQIARWARWLAAADLDAAGALQPLSAAAAAANAEAMWAGGGPPRARQTALERMR